MMDLVCFSHLRWDFVYQRPQHLMSRAAKTNRVFYIEEPIFNEEEDGYSLTRSEEGVNLVRIHLSQEDRSMIASRQADILEEFFQQKAIDQYLFWYYTPMMLQISDRFQPLLTIYDCMDELSAFKFANPFLKEKETALFQKAEIVFTGGYSLFKAKRSSHENIFCFPSSIDFEHFSKARNIKEEPADQKNIPYPRLGFFGVVDERFDVELLREAAALSPAFQFIIIGPVVKIDPADLPRAKNIHYLGSKKYHELPEYIAGWDVALILFALNESTRFISPTKTPEYLSAGKPVISTAIADVVAPYGNASLVQIISSAQDLIEKAEVELNRKDHAARIQNTDSFLSANSWDNTWEEMKAIIGLELQKQQENAKLKEYV